jgi:sec-independent protein translocase protein TatB
MVNPPPIQLGTLGMSDTLILMILALVVFGPRRLPQIGRQIGKLMYEFRKASNDFKFQMEEELRLSEEADRRKKEEAERARLQAVNPPAQTVESQAAIGAQESVSAPSHPLYGTGSGYPEAYPPQAATETAAEPQTSVPRIQPPSTGAPVPAARRGTAKIEQATEEQGPREPGIEGATTAEVAETNIGAAPSASAAETPAVSQAESEPQSESAPRTETVTQHG